MFDFFTDPDPKDTFLEYANYFKGKNNVLQQLFSRKLDPVVKHHQIQIPCLC